MEGTVTNVGYFVVTNEFAPQSKAPAAGQKFCQAGKDLQNLDSEKIEA